MPDMEVNLLRESIDLLILKSLTWGPKNAHGLMEWIQRATRTRVRIEEGTLYPALHRLTRRRLVHAEWGTPEDNRAGKLYELTPTGLRQLNARSSTWRRHVDAIGGALAMPSSEVAW
jgi:DNA-binding PadR family transcriptional regulator